MRRIANSLLGNTFDYTPVVFLSQVKYWIYGDPEKDAQVIDVKTPQAELTNLYPYCDYEMRVCAYNNAGDGYETDIIPCQTLEDGNHKTS